MKLEDVHPSLEVVDAFREVSGAFEEKNRLINEAEGYRNEQVALARGNAKASLAERRGYTAGPHQPRRGRRQPLHPARGSFSHRARPHRDAPVSGNHGAGSARKKKLIVDSSKARRHLFLLEDGVEIGGPALSPVFIRSAAQASRRSRAMHIDTGNIYPQLRSPLAVLRPGLLAPSSPVRETEFVLVTQFGRPSAPSPTPACT